MLLADSHAMGGTYLSNRWLQLPGHVLFNTRASPSGDEDVNCWSCQAEVAQPPSHEGKEVGINLSVFSPTKI